VLFWLGQFGFSGLFKLHPPELMIFKVLDVS